MNPSKMTPDELDDFLYTRDKVNKRLKKLSQFLIAAFVLSMLIVIWFILELAMLVKS